MLTGNPFQQVTADFFYQRAGCPLQTNSNSFRAMHIVEYCETGSSAQDDNKVTMVHVIIVVYYIAFYCRTTMKQANPRARLLKAFKPLNWRGLQTRSLRTLKVHCRQFIFIYVFVSRLLFFRYGTSIFLNALFWHGAWMISHRIIKNQSSDHSDDPLRRNRRSDIPIVLTSR